MKHFLRKTFLVLLGGVMCSLSATAQNTTTVGAENNTTEPWTAYSEGYEIQADKTLHLEFTNYTDGVYNWDNFYIDLRDMNNVTLAIYRADNFGWGNYYYGGLNDCNYDWNNFKALMNEAKVSLDIIRKSKVVEVKAEITGSDKNPYHQYYYLGVPDAEASIMAYLTTEKGHLVIDNDKTAVSNTEYTNTDAEGYTYTNDFSSTDGLEIVGSGSFVDDDVFGKAFKNATGGKRTNYLMLPDDLFAHSLYSQQLTIGFWVNSADAGASADYMWAPIFTAYETTTTGQDNGAPMFACQYRGVLQANCSGWCNYENAQNTNGTNELYHGDTDWLADKGWHYYTVVLDGDNAKVYFDGKLKNEWNANTEYMDGEKKITGTTQRGLFFKGDVLKKICLGGNQAWNWGDNDPGFKFAKFLATNKAMTAEEIAAQMEEDLPEMPKGLVGKIDNSTGYLGDFSEVLQLTDGQIATFEFTNYSAKDDNAHNWLACVSKGETFSTDAENLLVVLRADNWENIQWDNTGITSNYDWKNFITEMDESSVVTTFKYKDGKVTVRSKITAKSGNTYFEEFTKEGVEGTISVCMSVEKAHLIVTKAEFTDIPGKLEGQVGETDYTTPMYGDNSEILELTNGKMATFEFSNYSNTDFNLHSWVACVANSNAVGAENAIIVLRNDNFEEKQNSNEGIYSNFSWDYPEETTGRKFREEMNGANVKATVKFNNGRIIIRVDISSNTGTNYFEEFVKNVEQETVYTYITVNNSYLVMSKAKVTDLPEIPEKYVGYEDNTSLYLEDFSDVLTLTEGKIATFEFTNYSDKFANWHNWVVCVGGETFSAADLKVALRADKWENVQGSNSGITSDFNFDTDDMDGAKVVVTVTYKEGKAVIHADITTADNTERSIEFTKEGLEGTITAAMSIDHAHLVMTKAEVTDDPASSISTIDAQNATQDAPMFDLSGRRVDANYKGIVIQNGKKMIVK